MKAIYVRWHDSALASGWQSAPSENTGLAVIETIGYLVHEDHKHIQIAQSSFKECEKFDAIVSIPKSVILARRNIQL